jgi:hypothetical protein
MVELQVDKGFHQQIYNARKLDFLSNYEINLTSKTKQRLVLTDVQTFFSVEVNAAVISLKNFNTHKLRCTSISEITKLLKN